MIFTSRLNCSFGALALLAAAFATPAGAEPFSQWLQELRQEAVAQGIREQILDEALAKVEPIPRVIELDQRQPEFTLTFQQYIDRVVPLSRRQKARKRYATHQSLLDQIGEKFGVQPRFIVALWGIETDFGRTLGGFSVIASLATLAHDGRRSAYFRKELLNALHILNDGDIKVDKMIGSWAGAMGQSQFMPSSYRRFAVDHDGDGRRDIWGTKADVFASAANYLARSGWQSDQTWGREVRLPDNFDVALATKKVRKPLSEWRRLGVRRADGGDLPQRDLMARIVLPQKGATDPAFVVYKNYETILKWNRSNYFAIAVGRLSDAVGGK